MAKEIDVQAVAAAAVTKAQEAGRVVQDLAEKGSPNEPDGLMVTVLSDLSVAVTDLGRAVEALAKK